MQTLMLPQDDPAIANRRARLQEWITTHFGGSHTLFIASTNNGEKQMNQGELSALLRNKTFGERRARSLEAMAHMPPRYLEEPPGKQVEASPIKVQQPAKPIGYPAEDAPTPRPPVGWPFSRVTLARIVELRKQLGVRAGTQAMQDIDETLELVVSKWERRAASPAKSAA